MITIIKNEQGNYEQKETKEEMGKLTDILEIAKETNIKAKEYNEKSDLINKIYGRIGNIATENSKKLNRRLDEIRATFDRIKQSK